MVERSDHNIPKTGQVDPHTIEHFASKLGFSDNTHYLEQMLSMPSVAFEVFSQSQRRHVIQYLIDNGTPVSIQELSEYVAARDRQTSSAAITAGERDEVCARLIHVHLPKLVAFELIEWIPERGEVLLHDEFSGETDVKREPPRSERKFRESQGTR